ncbi:MAG: DUF1223 domain-containing protein [Pseudomonadota bacterium]|nr:DUF1223 domain-containing protein [Pseudomonadota bacterium]QKK05465.1 MAG: DUF1223 domain-containing protein [Pseudomonadota bacterium]
MRIMLILTLAIIGAAVFYQGIPYLHIVPAEAANGREISAQASDANIKNDHPVLLELFTSQACYSCPAAEALLRELAIRPDVITLEYHVDYWNELVYGLAGRWKDPYSSPQFTARQRDYNNVLRGSAKVYTPQIIINGAAETVGSRKKEIEQAVAAAEDSGIRLSAWLKDNMLQIETGGALPQETRLVLARYLKRAETDVISGENKGKNLVSYNVVTALSHIRPAQDENGIINSKITPLKADEHCAVFAQDGKTMEIRAATLCRMMR